MRILEIVTGLALALATTEMRGAAPLGNRTQADAFLEAATARPGDTVMAGVRLRMPEGWHTYWQNPGESGGATKIEWTLPQGVTAGEIRWPVPEKLVTEGIVTYVYHHEAVLLVPLRLAAEVPAGTLLLKARVSFLECDALQCIPGKADVATSLIVGDTATSSKDTTSITEAGTRLPVARADADAKATWDEPPAGEAPRPLVFAWTARPGVVDADFFPLPSPKFSLKDSSAKAVVADGKIRLRKAVEKLEGDWPAEIAGLLIEKAADGKVIAAAPANVPVAAPNLAQAAPALAPPEANSAAAPSPGSETASATRPGSLALNLLLGFLGGMLLNLMPCVLPVISLKILSFVGQSGGSPARARQLGLIYGAGVVFSLLVLAGAVIAGRLGSWGQQFQSPVFIVLTTTLVTLVALNLFGVFEVTLGGSVMNAAGDLSSREGPAGAFFNGVLTVVLATPCTAPALASAVGYAFYQPAHVVVLVFTAVGLGLAAPYMLLSSFPRLLKFLPKPGAWMEHFKVAMGFPMLATGVWLLTLTAPHFGGRGVLWVGLFLAVTSMAAWIWGQFVQRGSGRKGWAVAIATGLLLAGYVIALEQQLNWRHPAPVAKAGPPAAGASGTRSGIAWQPWSSDAVAGARAAGRPVLVDFTADWCLTCQANKKTSLEILSVEKKLKEINAATFLGDYTLEDPLIEAELKRYNRAGVPLVLVFPRDATQPALVLPALLTPPIVLEALDRAAR